jgi:GAF domain-containing protein
MQNAPLPENEAERQQRLDACGLLSTPPSSDVDVFLGEVATHFGVQTALFTVVDRDRQWFRNKFGMESSETPRSISFCGWAIHSDRLMVVPDAAEDERFVDNPLVVGKPFIRFYAGAPLFFENGAALGTLCLLDPTAREFNEAEQSELRQFSLELAEMALPTGA